MSVFTLTIKASVPHWDTPYDPGMIWSQMSQQWQYTEETWDSLGIVVVWTNINKEA